MPRFDPGPLQEVARRDTADGRVVVSFSQQFPHSPDVVWQAITDPAVLSRWAPYTADRDLGSVGPAVLTMLDGDESELDGEVLEADLLSVLDHRWGQTSNLRWELAGRPGGTQLTVHTTLYDSEMSAENAAGWHLCFHVLGQILDGQPVGPIIGRTALDYGWTELRDSYAAVFAS